MEHAPPKQPTLKELDISYYITRYTNLLWRSKLWILIIAPVCTAILFVYLLKFGPSKPELEASVMIGLENSDSRSAVTDIGETTQLSRLALIRAKGFLSDIVDLLFLRFQMKKYSLHEVFDSVFVDTIAPPARYDLTIEEGVFKILFTNKSMNLKKKIVETGSLQQLEKFSGGGISVVFDSTFLKNPHNVTWFIVRQRDAVDWLLKNLTVHDQNIRSSYGRDNFAGISLKGRDYRRITLIINTIANEFVKKSLSFKKRRSNDAIEVLEKQLNAAADQVATTQAAVREFRNNHPSVALAAELQSSISNMAMLESSMHASRNYSAEAQRISNQLSTSTEADQNLLINEALLFLSRQGVVAAAVLENEFNLLSEQQTTLSAGYAKNHPQVTENRRQMATVKAKTLNLLSEYTKSAANESYQQSNRIQEITSRMRGLPVQQLQLAELERNAQVASQIHSSVLGRYNEAKISNAVEMPDAFIMDYAIEPEEYIGLNDYLKIIGMGLFGILLLTFGPPVLFDLLDKTARSKSEVSNYLPFTFLEAIPVIDQPLKKHTKKIKKETSPLPTTIRQIDSKLITASYSPDYTNEIFRSLRSKLMLSLHDIDTKRLLITSLGPNEGKSLISANLSITMAQQKLKTVLIDGDIRRGVQHNTFSLQKKPGLSDFLFSEDAITPESIANLLQSTHVPNLSVISSGPNVPNPSELLGLPRLEILIDQLSKLFDILILDTPPLGVSVDAAIVGKFFSGTVLVIKHGVTNIVALKKRLKEFPNFQENIIGTVLNQTILDSSMKKYKYYTYHY